MSNAIVSYMEAENIGPSELADRLKISVSYASELKNGVKDISVNIARKLSSLTGRPWHEYLSEGSQTESVTA